MGSCGSAPKQAAAAPAPPARTLPGRSPRAGDASPKAASPKSGLSSSSPKAARHADRSPASSPKGRQQPAPKDDTDSSGTDAAGELTPVGGKDRPRPPPIPTLAVGAASPTHRSPAHRSPAHRSPRPSPRPGGRKRSVVDEVHAMTPRERAVAAGAVTPRRFSGGSDHSSKHSDTEEELTIPPKIGRLQLEPGGIRKGSYSIIRKYKDVDTLDLVCAKCVPKVSMVVQKRVDDLKREMSILKVLHHPHLVRFVGVQQTKEAVILRMTYAGSMNIRDLCIQAGADEDVARDVMSQIVLALVHLHHNSIAHRNLRPEHVVLNKEDPNQRGYPTVKVVGFGHACGSRSHSRIPMVPPSVIGKKCDSYTAPELLMADKHGLRITLLPERFDLWGLGGVLYFLFVGKDPFAAPTDAELEEAVGRGHFQAHPALTRKARDLVAKLLVPDSSARLALENVMKHGFFGEDYISQEDIDRSRGILPPDEVYEDDVQVLHFGETADGQAALIQTDAPTPKWGGPA